jgi:hypothetical protein
LDILEGISPLKDVNQLKKFERAASGLVSILVGILS